MKFSYHHFCDSICNEHTLFSFHSSNISFEKKKKRWKHSNLMMLSFRKFRKIHNFFRIQSLNWFFNLGDDSLDSYLQLWCFWNSRRFFVFFEINIEIDIISEVFRCIKRDEWMINRCHCKRKEALRLQIRWVEGLKSFRIRTTSDEDERTAELLHVRIWRKLRLRRIRVKLRWMMRSVV